MSRLNKVHAQTLRVEYWDGGRVHAEVKRVLAFVYEVDNRWREPILVHSYIYPSHVRYTNF